MSSDSRPLFVQFGAGNIGRSLVGSVFSRAGYEIAFVEALKPVVDALNRERRYRVVVKDDLPPNDPGEFWVENVRGIPAKDLESVADAVAQADLIGTAVGAGVLPKLYPALAEGLRRRTKPVSILFCENLRNVPALARSGLAECLPKDFDFSRVGLVATSIGKMVPLMPADVRERDPLEVWGEAYNRILADADGFAEPPPPVDGLVLKRNFAAYVDRKLFVHNFGHAAAAYFGFLQGKEHIWECMETPGIRSMTEAAMRETGRALVRRYPGEFDAAEMNAHVDDLLRRFGNRALGDTVFRVGRDLARKLSPEDRCIGALRLAAETGGDVEPICRVIAAALRFAATDAAGVPFTPDAEFRATLLWDGAQEILRKASGLNSVTDRTLLENIRREMKSSAAHTL